jgi:hypothetical protein
MRHRFAVQSVALLLCWRSERRQIASLTADLLKNLETQNKYLFHGSDTIVDLLAPAYSRNRGRADAEPTVFATEFPVIAVFHALARTVKRSDPAQRPRKHGFSVDKGTITLRAEPTLLAAIKGNQEPTNIYLLDKRDFQHQSEMEWRARQRISPLGVVFVDGRDLAGLLDVKVKLERLAGT